MGSQVAVAEIAVVPTFRGFRRDVTKETDSSAKAGAQGFSRTFSKTGTDTGKTVGAGFKKAFEQSADGVSSKVTKALEADVAKASRALSAARLKEQDAAGKVRLAEKQLAESREKYAADSSQVIRAEERLATASRQLRSSHELTERSTDDLKRAQGELARAADRAGDELAEAGNRGVTGFRSNVVGGVKSFAGPLVAAFAALGIGNIVADAFRGAFDFVKSSLGAASDLEQSVGGVDAVFKDQAKTIHEWAKGAASAVGLSQSKYNEFATVIGSQFKNMGVPIDQIAGKTNDLIVLAADLAATYGGSTADAVSALSSLLRGERDPMEKYGVSISDAALEARLLAKGLDGLEGPARDEAKRQEALALLYDQTKDAQGGAIREQDTYAAKMQENAAKWEDLSARIGTAFLPVATSIADVLSKDVFPVIEKLVDEHGPDLAKAFADALPALAEMAKDVLPQLPGLFKGIADTLPAVVDLLGDLAPLLIDSVRFWGDATSTVDAFFDLLSGDTSLAEIYDKMITLEGPLGDVARWFSNTGYDMGRAVGGAARTIGEKIGEIVGFLGSLPGRALAAVGDLGDLLYSSGRALMDGFLKGIRSMIDKITSTVSDAIDWVMGFFPNSPAKRGPLAGAGWTRLEKSGEAYWEQWIGGMGGTGPTFPGLPSGMGPAFPSGASAAPSSGGASFPGKVELVLDSGERFTAYVRTQAGSVAEQRGRQLAGDIRARRRADA